jgi:hypothetical protein
VKRRQAIYLSFLRLARLFHGALRGGARNGTAPRGAAHPGRAQARKSFPFFSGRSKKHDRKNMVILASYLYLYAMLHDIGNFFACVY